MYVQFDHFVLPILVAKVCKKCQKDEKRNLSIPKKGNRVYDSLRNH